jgi:hypothetical protein
MGTKCSKLLMRNPTSRDDQHGMLPEYAGHREGPSRMHEKLHYGGVLVEGWRLKRDGLGQASGFRRENRVHSPSRDQRAGATSES